MNTTQNLNLFFSVSAETKIAKLILNSGNSCVRLSVFENIARIYVLREMLTLQFYDFMEDLSFGIQ